jgi:hypothetical protein
MDDATQAYKFTFSSPIYKNFGYIVWFIFIVLSIHFYQERAAFMDAAFQLVDLINTGQFSIHHYRLTNPLTQIFAWIGIKSGMPLKYIMIGYSVNFIVFHLIIYHLIVNWCKNHFLGLVQIGFFTLLVTQSFYFVPPEFYQGMSLLLLWTSILLQPTFRSKKWKYPILSLLMIAIIFDHTLLSAFMLFIWIFLILHDRNYLTLQFLGLLIMMILIFMVHEAYFTGWYEIDRKEHFWRHWNQYYPNFFNIPGNKIFLSRCLDTYYLFPIGLLIISYGYLRAFITKQTSIKSPILKLLLVFGFCFCYILINHINDPNTPFLFYSEVNYIGLVIPIGIALTFDILPRVETSRVTILLVAIVLFSRIGVIVKSSETLKERHQWMLKIIDQSESNKVYVKGSDTPKDSLSQTWAVPEETLLLTSIGNKKV